MTVRGCFGTRSLDSMLRDWNAHRAAVQTGDIEEIQNTFDACEEWIDFALGRGHALVLEDRKKITPAGSLQPGQAAPVTRG